MTFRFTYREATGPLGEKAAQHPRMRLRYETMHATVGLVMVPCGCRATGRMTAPSDDARAAIGSGTATPDTLLHATLVCV